MKTFDEQLSRTISNIVRAKIKACWENSIRGAFALAKRSPDEMVWYVEGFVYDEQFRIYYEHGWIETETMILDPTRVLHQNIGYEYFPGAFFQIGKDLVDKKKAKGMLPLVRSCGAGGMAHSGYKQSLASVHLRWKELHEKCVVS